MIRTAQVCARALILLMLLTIVCTYTQGVAYAEVEVAPSPSATQDTYNANAPELLESANLVAKSAVVIDSQRNEILFDKNANARMLPASTTKVMTLLLAVEHGNMDEEIVVPEAAGKIPKDSSVVPISVGERMAFRDLLYGLMLHSGNDAANAVAVIVAGSEEKFVQMMNARAAEIGCKNTHFANAHGYPVENHYSTAYDLALITREGMKNPEFRTIMRAATYTMAETNKHDSRTLVSTNLMINDNSTFYYRPIIGGKTGSSSKAGYCFVGVARKDNREFISVALNSTEKSRWGDTQRLFEYAYTHYTTYSFAELYERSPVYVKILEAHPDDLTDGLLMMHIIAGATDDYKVMCLDDELDAVIRDFASRMSVEYTRELTAPVVAGDVFGTLTFTPEDSEPLSTMVIAAQNVRVAPKFFLIEWFPQLENVSPQLFQFAGVVVIALIASIIGVRMRLNVRHRRRKRRKQKYPNR